MNETRRLAEAIRTAGLAAAREAYEDAGIRGLCPEGRWEAALGAVAALDLDLLVLLVENAGQTDERTGSEKRHKRLAGREDAENPQREQI